jgi:hypothetical protein
MLLRFGVSAGTEKIDDKLRPSTFHIDYGPPNVRFTLCGQNISFINHVKYLCVIYDKRITWRLKIEMIEAKVLRTFITIYSLFRSEFLYVTIKQTLHKALIRAVMTYSCPTWKFVVDTYFLKCSVCRTRFSTALEIF